ncbi:hypothetical protein [Burkholderia cepacia]|uniref:hypothetical protein n=1 Tax=Burkholderia cepacia TaxID=292 RepID=UPI0035DED29D
MYKGAVNGVSLTVNTIDDRADGCKFAINLIPYTAEVTTLRHVKAGDKVDLEVDMIARHVERMLSTSQGVHQD